MSCADPILIVEDDTNAREMLAELLRGQGFELDACADPLCALENLRSKVYSVLITDNVMPGMSGSELTRVAHDLQPSLRCYVMSGQEPPPADQWGRVAWLTKPLDIDALLSALGCP